MLPVIFSVMFTYFALEGAFAGAVIVTLLEGWLRLPSVKRTTT